MLLISSVPTLLVSQYLHSTPTANKTKQNPTTVLLHSSNNSVGIQVLTNNLAPTGYYTASQTL